MDEDEMAEEHQGFVNQFCLDLLLRRVVTTVLRRKFREIWAKLNEGQEWTDGREAGEKFCRSKLGNPAFVNAVRRQQEMMEEGDIQQWDLNCLQAVITQMLTTAMDDKRERDNKNSNCPPSPLSVTWDERWWAQMSSVRQLANIRHSIAHMPNEMVSQSEFDEKWAEAVVALRVLGAKKEEINEILQISQSVFSSPAAEGQTNFEDIEREVEELRAKIQQLQLQSQVKGQEDEGKRQENEVTGQENEVAGQENEVKVQQDDTIQDEVNCPKDEFKGQITSKSLVTVGVNMKNELRASSFKRKGDLASRSGDLDKALEFYTRALEIPEISDDLQNKIYTNRSWAHLQILRMPENPPFNLNLTLPESGQQLVKFEAKKVSKKSGEKLSSHVLHHTMEVSRGSTFLDEKLLKIDHQKLPEELTEEVKNFHLAAGMADAESAVKLSADQNIPKAFYHLAQFHQFKGDWRSALTFFDRALDKSDPDDKQLDLDRNVCQLGLLNQAEVEEFNWIPGEKNQTMAGLDARRNPLELKKAADTTDPDLQYYAQVAKAHFLAQGFSWRDDGGQNTNAKKLDLDVTKRPFDQVVQLYKGAWEGGLPSGIYNLGLLLQEGKGVQSPDFYGAVRLFKMAAHLPVNDGNDNGREKNPWWAKKGVLEAQYRLGLCYEFGLGVNKDEKKALHWYEMAGMKNYARANRRLGDIYSEGRLRVCEDMDMAMLCWKHAAIHGDYQALMSLGLHSLFRRTVVDIASSIARASRAISWNSQCGTDTMLAAMLNRKRQYESTIASVLQDLTKSNPTIEENDDTEPKGASWNIPAFAEHTMHTIYLLELVQTPEFQNKLLDISPNWRSQSSFIFTDRLLRASSFCNDGLAALEELNKLYLACSNIKDNHLEDKFLKEYPPNIRGIAGVDEALLAREDHLLVAILDAFANSLRLVGAANFRDQPTQSLIISLAVKTFDDLQNQRRHRPLTPDEQLNRLNAGSIMLYLDAFKCVDAKERLEELEHFYSARTPNINPFLEHFHALSAAAIQGSLGKFEEAAQNLQKYLKKLVGPQSVSEHDVLFAQAVCCKSAALTRGVNSVQRKKIKESMDMFRKFLSSCSKDEPRRAEAHYQLALCTLYLEKMKVKGQVKSSTAKDILDKVLVQFDQGEIAEQDAPWKDVQFPVFDSLVKRALLRKIKDLEELAGKSSGQRLTSVAYLRKIQNQSCLAKFVDPAFKFPTSLLDSEFRRKRRAKIIKEFRKLFKAAHQELGTGSQQTEQLQRFLNENIYRGSELLTRSLIRGCYEIVEPILHFQLPDDCVRYQIVSEEHPEIQQRKILALTVVQDESGSLFNFQFQINYRGGEDKGLEQLTAFRMGGRIIVREPHIRIKSQDEGTSLVVLDAEARVFHLPSLFKEQKEETESEKGLMVAKKCGFCGKVGEIPVRCSKCLVVGYCDKECQIADWKKLKHHWICPFLRSPSGSR